MKRLWAVLIGGIFIGAGGAVAARALLPTRNADAGPDLRIVVEKVREVARLETLDVAVYKKIDWEPEPEQAKSRMGELANWAMQVVAPPKARAIVFATAHLGLDFKKLDRDAMRVEGGVVTVALPAIVANIELRPGETEVISSNLNSQQMARMMEAGREALEADVMGDAVLKERARTSARRALRTFFLGAGFKDVRFVDALPRRAQST